MNAIEGTVIPPTLATLAFGTAEYEVATKALPGGRTEAAYFGDRPPTIPVDATLDGEPVRILQQARSRNRSSVVLILEPRS